MYLGGKCKMHGERVHPLRMPAARVQRWGRVSSEERGLLLYGHQPETLSLFWGQPAAPQGSRPHSHTRRANSPGLRATHILVNHSKMRFGEAL